MIPLRSFWIFALGFLVCSLMARVARGEPAWSWLITAAGILSIACWLRRREPDRP